MPENDRAALRRRSSGRGRLDGRRIRSIPGEAPGAVAPHVADERRTETGDARSAGAPDAWVDDARGAGGEQMLGEFL